MITECGRPFQVIGGITRACSGRLRLRLAAAEAQALSAAVQSAFDAAVIDVRLHSDVDDDSGLSLALAFKRLAPQTKVVLLTGYPLRTDQVVNSIRFVGVETLVEKSRLVGPSGVSLAATTEEILRKPIGLNRLSLSVGGAQTLKLDC